MEYFLKVQKTGWLGLYVKPPEASELTLVAEYRSFDGLLKGLQEHTGKDAWIRLEVAV